MRQVPMANKIKDLLFGSFKNRIEGFGSVAVDLASGKLLDAVVNPLMAGKLFCDGHNRPATGRS